MRKLFTKCNRLLSITNINTHISTSQRHKQALSNPAYVYSTRLRAKIIAISSYKPQSVCKHFFSPRDFGTPRPQLVQSPAIFPENHTLFFVFSSSFFHPLFLSLRHARNGRIRLSRCIVFPESPLTHLLIAGVGSFAKPVT